MTSDRPDQISHLSCLAEFNNPNINALAITLLRRIWPQDGETPQELLYFIFDNFQFLESFLFGSKRCSARVYPLYNKWFTQKHFMLLTRHRDGTELTGNQENQAESSCRVGHEYNRSPRKRIHRHRVSWCKNLGPYEKMTHSSSYCNFSFSSSLRTN